MLVRRLSQLLMPAAFAVAIVAFAAFDGGSVAKAQGRFYDRGYYDYGRNYQNRHQRREREALRRHQREERYLYSNSHALRRHQQQERWELKRHHRFERNGGFNGYGRSRFYRRGF